MFECSLYLLNPKPSFAANGIRYFLQHVDFAHIVLPYCFINLGFCKCPSRMDSQKYKRLNSFVVRSMLLLFIKTLRWQGLITKSLKRNSDCNVPSFKLSTFSPPWLHKFHTRLMYLIADLAICLIKQVPGFVQSIIRFSGLSKDFTSVLLTP